MKLNFTFSALGIFLILLSVAVIFVLYCRMSMESVEGFISYNNEKVGGDVIMLANYSSVNSLTKLYDSMYYDIKNRNLVQLFGTEYTGTTDPSGTTLTSIDIVPIGGADILRFDVNNGHPPVDESKVGMVVPITFKSWIYPDSNVYSNSNLTPYQVIHVPYVSFDLLHVYDVINKKHINTVMYTGELSATPVRVIKQPYATDIVLPTMALEDKNAVNNVVSSKIKELYAGLEDIYQLTSRVFYDTYTGNLLINVDASENTVKLDVYARNSIKLKSGITSKIDITVAELQTAITAPADKTVLNSWIVVDGIGKTTVLYIPSPVDTTTLIVLLKVDPANSALLTIQDAVLFTAPVSIAVKNDVATATETATETAATGIDITTKFTAIKIPLVSFKKTTETNTSVVDISGVNTITANGPTNEDELEKVIGDYYSRYWKNNNLPMDGNFSTDFLLKTQIIPPICPACPACPKSNASVCTNCGGSGGSGSLIQTQSQFATTATNGSTTGTGTGTGKELSFSGVVGGAGNVANTAVTGVGSVANNMVSGVGGVANTAVSGAGNVANTAVSSAGNVANTAVSGIGGIASNVVGTTGNLAQNTVNMLGDVAEETVNEVGDVTTGAIGVTGNIINKTVGTVGNVIENSASTVNGLLGDPYNSIKRNMRENEMRRNTALTNTYNERQQNPAITNGSYGGYGFPPVNVPSYNTTESRTNPYGYYGNKTENTSNYLPITANFSSFGK